MNFLIKIVYKICAEYAGIPEWWHALHVQKAFFTATWVLEGKQLK